MERMSRDKIIELSNGVLFSERLTMGLGKAHGGVATKNFD